MGRSSQRKDAVFAVYRADVTNSADSTDDLTGFARELAKGVFDQRLELDALIGEYAVGWDVDRIAPLERAILRVCLFEMLHRPDVPTEVAIDEAVELAKEYCGADAPSFVNGILGTAAKEASN